MREWFRLAFVSAFAAAAILISVIAYITILIIIFG